MDFLSARDAPTPTARVLDRSALRASLPENHPEIGPDERRRRLARRREAAWSRFR